MNKSVMQLGRSYGYYAAWAVAVGATFGSLFLSEVMQLVPCVLCWYQRIAMYPIAVILTVGLLDKERNIWRYVLPLAVMGAGIAFYHTLLQWEIIPEAAAPCQLGISCTTKDINLLGFITIPFMSLVSFLTVIATTLLARGGQNE